MLPWVILPPVVVVADKEVKAVEPPTAPLKVIAPVPELSVKVWAPFTVEEKFKAPVVVIAIFVARVVAAEAVKEASGVVDPMLAFKVMVEAPGFKLSPPGPSIVEGKEMAVFVVVIVLVAVITVGDVVEMVSVPAVIFPPMLIASALVFALTTVREVSAEVLPIDPPNTMAPAEPALKESVCAPSIVPLKEIFAPVVAPAVVESKVAAVESKEDPVTVIVPLRVVTVLPKFVP